MRALARHVHYNDRMHRCTPKGHGTDITSIARFAIALAFVCGCSADVFGVTDDSGAPGDSGSPSEASTSDAMSDAPTDPDGGAQDAPTSDTSDATTTADTSTSSKTVFVTSQTYQANFGGATGANAICALAATSGSLSGTYKAWVSTSTSSPSSTFTHSSDPYRLVDKTLVASNYTQLVSGALSHSIDEDENGTIVTAQPVWTQTASDGTKSNGVLGCTDFEANGVSDEANSGSTDKIDATWTWRSQYTCDYKLAIYCFEQ